MAKKSIYGVGVNDSPYSIARNELVGGKRKQVWVCPFYRTWRNMLKRSYYDSEPTYAEVTVCNEWHTFSIFKQWMEQQDWEGKALDKDLLFPGNLVYSPETCVFIDQAVNLFITESRVAKGRWPVGVSWRDSNQKFQAQIGNLGKGQSFIGYFDCPQEAHKAWLTKKLKFAKILAEQQTDPRIAKALIDRYTNYKGESN
jgi:hypothetical protein